jgi:hypothetical protein
MGWDHSPASGDISTRGRGCVDRASRAVSRQFRVAPGLGDYCVSRSLASSPGSLDGAVFVTAALGGASLACKVSVGNCAVLSRLAAWLAHRHRLVAPPMSTFPAHRLTAGGRGIASPPTWRCACA